MSARVVDPAEVAARFRAEVREEVAAVTRRHGATPRIVGLLSQGEGPARTYAQWAARGAADVGIEFVLREVEPGAAADAVREADADPGVHGIFCYYPLADADEDPWLRELVDPRKDVEGMHSFWSRMLYENRRVLDGDRRAILPCTPLAILKLLDDAGLRRSGERAPLEGVTACVINRSDVVGRPLAAMLANDGAEVVSLDLDGTVVFEPAIGRHAHAVRDSDETRPRPWPAPTSS